MDTRKPVSHTSMLKCTISISRVTPYAENNVAVQRPPCVNGAALNHSVHQLQLIPKQRFTSLPR